MPSREVARISQRTRWRRHSPEPWSAPAPFATRLRGSTEQLSRFAVEELKRERRQRAEVPELGVEHHVAELEDLRRAMQSLSPRQRLALILHCVEDLPVDEVARGTGLSPSTVRVHIHRGRNRLRRILGPKEVADG